MKHTLETGSMQLQFGFRTILSNVYLKCETGKITGLLGRNGQGKSCLLQATYGTRACEKSVQIDGISVLGSFKKPGLLRYLPQFNFIPASLTLKRIFSDYAIDFSSFREIFPEFAAGFHTRIGNISGGGRRLIEIYVILKSKTHFVMLDEPFTHVSPLHTEKLKDLMIEEKKNKGLLVTDHMYRQVLEVCDEVYVLSDGATYLTKTIEDIERLGYTSLGTNPLAAQ